MKAVILGLCVVFVGCGDDGGSAACELDLSFEAGGDGVDDPSAVPAGQARAGRLSAAADPGSPSGLGVWAPGDFVLANERIAVVIEDVGASDLYDPWGGKPVGVFRVEGGALVDPADFGEFFILTGRYGLLATSVGVVNDGTDGAAAVVRASGVLRPLPFYEAIVGGLLRDEFDDIPSAIEYVLEPGADHVDIYFVHKSPRAADAEVPTKLHGFMYTPRTPTYAPGRGFDTEGKDLAYLGFIDDDATSWAYFEPEGDLGSGISASGFTANLNDGFTIPACAEMRRHHARLVVGGPGLDGLRRAVARTTGEELRAVTGTVRDAGGAPAAGVRVHAEDTDGGYVTRATTGADGVYTLHAPVGQALSLTAWRRGDALLPPAAVSATDTGADFDLPATGTIHVLATGLDGGGALPVRVQVLPVSGSAPSLPGRFGEPSVTGGRVHVDFAMNGESTLRVPVGDWRVVVSRGFEYELHDEAVSVVANTATEVAAVLERVVDSTGVMCADYHIHTSRSADSPDDGTLKVASAVADGLEIPVRSDHEYAQSFAPEVASLGVADWAYGMASVELTTMEAYGHFGVLPIEPDPSLVNGGTPRWQTFPTADDPDAPLVTMPPPEVFAEVRARGEQPAIIVNHPRGGANYFDYVAYDNTTGLATYPELWDETLGLVEVFNDSSWLGSRSRTVVDWLSFLDNGRRVFAVGSSDSHRLSSSPVGYPRTCLELGTDDPGALTDDMVRDATAGGHSTIYGGVYVTARVGEAGPGDDATGVAATVEVQVTLQAPSWIDVDWIDVVVDGETVETIAVLPGDADPLDPTIRFDAPLTVNVAATGSYVIIAAWGERNLDPVHPGRQPFGVTNPIFLRR